MMISAKFAFIAVILFVFGSLIVTPVSCQSAAEAQTLRDFIAAVPGLVNVATWSEAEADVACRKPNGGWLGLLCSSDNSTIISILGSDSLASYNGYIPTSISNLQNLTTFLLYMIYTQPVPSSMATLEKLTTITIKSKETSGQAAQPFPSFLFDMQQVTFLQVQGFNYNSNDISGVTNLTKLTLLNLAANQIKAPLPDFSNMTKLTALDLSQNDFSGDIANVGLTRLSSCTIAMNPNLPCPSSFRVCCGGGGGATNAGATSQTSRTSRTFTSSSLHIIPTMMFAFVIMCLLMF